MMVDVRIPMADLLTCLSDTLDLGSPELANHHILVAYIAFSIANEIGLDEDERRTLVTAGALHDIGAFSLETRRDLLRFESSDEHSHAETGYHLLQMFEPFHAAADAVRFHHVRWEDGRGQSRNGVNVPRASHILHIADRVAIQINGNQPIRTQIGGIVDRIVQQSGDMFVPEYVEAFRAVARREYFWFDVTSRSLGEILKRRVLFRTLELDMAALVQLANLFRRIIDFKSPFTATHCSGVAASAEALARLAGFVERDCAMMRVASYLHDLGKLAVPAEIIDKPARLTNEEFEIMQSHVYHTYRVLEPIPDLAQVRDWGGFHQERLDGSGYPFHLKGEALPAGARLLAVADVFTAITEDRPYRAGMPSDQAFKALERMVHRNQLDAEYVDLLAKHFDEIDARRRTAQEASQAEYRQFLCDVGELRG